MLEIKNVNKFFAAKKVLQNISFSLKKNNPTVLLGENGAGKSTLLRVISGFLPPSSGTVNLDGDDIINARQKVLQKIGYVQEISALYANMSVYDFLRFAADLHQIPPAETAAKIKYFVDALQLKDVLMQKNETLSKGYKKRVELAAAMLFEPEVLLLDEPTEGLDPNQKQVLRAFIRQYAKNHIVLISTHTMEDVEALAKRVLVIHKGVLRADSSLEAFTENGKDLLASFSQITKN